MPYRLCLTCGRSFDAEQYTRTSTPCASSDEVAPCLLDMLDAEVSAHWRKAAHDRASEISKLRQALTNLLMICDGVPIPGPLAETYAEEARTLLTKEKTKWN